jgi:paraquat-inducible protein B
VSDDKDNLPQDKLPQDKIPQDKIPQDKIPQDKIPQDKIPIVRSTVDRPPSDGSRTDTPSTDQPPMPHIRKMHWPFPLIWIVPLVAAGLAGYFLLQHHQENGIDLTISLNDAAGIKEGQTTVALHGVTIGHVKKVELSQDHKKAVAHLELQTSARFVARSGTVFWLVRPEVTLQNISGLNTIVSGPYVDCRPGEGLETHGFDALDNAPQISGPGISLILVAERIDQLAVDSPVNFRGIQVGTVKDVRLASTADGVNVTVFIWERYKNLVRTKSKFWLIKGADVQGGLFSGIKVKLGSVQNLLVGGVAFATPEEDYGEFVTDGMHLPLHDQVDDKWLKWRSVIQLPPDATTPGNSKPAPDSGKSQLPMLKNE